MGAYFPAETVDGDDADYPGTLYIREPRAAILGNFQ